MITFWILAAVMIAVALWFIVPPLLSKGRTLGHTQDEANVAIFKERLQELQNDLDSGILDRDQFEQANQELQQALAEDLAPAQPEVKADTSLPGRWGAAVASVGVAVVAVTLYLQLGTSHLMNTASLIAQDEAGEQLPSINTMVSNLAQRLEENPDNPEGWTMLGRSYMVLERYQDASRAYAKAHQLIGDVPWLLVSYAEAVAYAQEGNMTGQPAQLVERALEREPDNQKALWLAGIAAAQQGNQALAERRFRRLLELLPADEEVTRQVRMMMTRLGLDQLNQAGPDTAAPPPRPTALNVQISLASELSNQVEPSDTVFIFARAPEGPRMPLAVLRKQVKDLPLNITLDDSMAMIPEHRLSRFSKVRVVAQVSKSGTANAQSGDLRGTSSLVAVNDDREITVTIDEIVP